MTDKEHLSDQALVEQYLGGSSESLALLIGRYKSRLYSYILYTVGSRVLVDDLFQETCLKAIHSIIHGKYREQGKMLSWFIRIAHNLIMDHYRRERQYPTERMRFGDEDRSFLPQHAEESVEEVLVRGQIHDDVRSLLQRLSREQREIVLMRFYGDLSFKEIADLSGISINTALGRMRYALINLRKLMNQHHISLTLP